MQILPAVQTPESMTAEMRAYSVENDNAVSLKIYHFLLEAFHECERHGPRYLNIVAIFFHHLMRLLTGCVLKSSELKQFNISEAALSSFRPLKEFPGVGYHEILTGRIDVGTMSRLSTPGLSLTKQKTLVNFFSKIFKGRKKVAILGVDNDILHILKHLFSRGLNPFFVTEAKVHIPKYREQMEILDRVFRKLILTNRLNIDASELMRLYVKWASPFIAKQPVDDNFDLLLTGTMLRAETRVVAANARAAGKPVVSISHGEGDLLIVDEPRTGYGELTFPTTYIGFGKLGKECMDRSVYSRSLYEQPSFVSANSNVCKKLYDPARDIPPLLSIKNPVFMYIPTNLIAEERYGPFHNFPDPIYEKWQKTVYELFPDAIFKKHPKEKPSNPVHFKRVETRRLVKCLDAADVFIFDFISTAFNIAAATDKPIIYFDIGSRNIHPDALRHLKDRTIWIDARYDKSAPYLKSELRNQEDKRLINSYTEKFCINTSDKKREDTIIDVVSQAILG